MNIKPNDKVKILNAEGYLAELEGVTGTVERVYPEHTPPIAIVKFEEDPTVASCMTVKVYIDNLVKVEPEVEIPEGAKQISKDDFDAALKEITSPERALSNNKIEPTKLFFAAMTTMIIGRKVSERLFENQSSITVTEDQFIDAIWSACSPVNVSEGIDNKISVRKCAHISLTTTLDLLEIVPILFGEGEE